MRKMSFPVIGLLLASVLLTGCHSVYKTLRIEPFDWYSTNLKHIKLTPELTVKYPNESKTLLRIEDPPKYARLAADMGSGMAYHAYTNKALLPAWDTLFDRFLIWQSSPGDVETVSDSVETRKYGGYMDKDVRFVNVAGRKYLVFITYQTLGSDTLMAYDEDNVRRMKALYQQLDTVLIAQ